MNDAINALRRQSEENGFAEVLNLKVISTVQEVATHFKREAPDVTFHFELCGDGVILSCDERCLGLTGTIKRNGELTMTFPAGKNLEQVILSETEFQSRKPVLEGAAKWANSRLEDGA
jgi:hypothetical protein